MNKSEELNKDILDRYIKPEKIEKAPAGFTDRVMNRIKTEKIPSAAGNNFLSNYRIPLIYIGVTLVFLIFAVITTPTENDTAVYSVLKQLGDLTYFLPKFNFEKLAGFTIPGWFIYISIGMFMLSVFDRALNALFNRGRK